MPPVVNSHADTAHLYVSFTHPQESDVFRWVVYEDFGGRWNYTIYSRFSHEVEVPLFRMVDVPVRGNRDSTVTRTDMLNRIAVSAVDRMGNESQKVFIAAPEVVPPSEPE